ncbi:MAG: hypothetical protein KGJ34_02600 [Patescibacteria group bacterium]|nr:hypothetical protein [Patescibacteria group bacterium]
MQAFAASLAGFLFFPLFAFSTWFSGAPYLPPVVPSPSPATTTPVVLQSLSPQSGAVGTLITLGGRGFTKDNTILFGSDLITDIPASPAVFNCPMIPVGSSTSCGTYSQVLTFTVPASLNPPCYYSKPACEIASRMTPPGVYAVSVRNSNGTSNARTFTVTTPTSPPPAPTQHVSLYSITPASGPTGTVVTLTGFGFAQSNTIRFAGGGIYNVPISSTRAIMCTDTPNCHGGIQQTLVFTIPTSIGAYCPPGVMMVCPMYERLVTPGSYPISVENQNGISNSVTFIVSS